MHTLLTLLALAAAPPAERVDYLRHIKPLLAERCASCHGALAQKGKLRVDTAAFLLKGGRNGPAVVPGKSGESLLVEAVLGTTRGRMPPENEGAELTAEQVALLRSWIDQGANAPKYEPIPEDPRNHWAFQKPTRPPLPAGDWGRNPIDAFIGAEHVKHGLKAQPEADRATLLRRVSLDLTGLPPTREQLHAFLADRSPNAYEKVVDRLLASPHHGERWARHWMDVWRYSDWYGRRQEKDWRNSSPTMWKWRDWIVRSLNAGKGYDRMVQEMLAADEIAPEDDAAQPATSFLARNYYSLNPDTWMKDQVEHTAKAFLGLTLNCCHCHDHKYDPISQREYFRFRAFFEPLGLRQDRVPGEPDPGPFKKYVYGGSGKVIDGGLVRVMDERFTALTRMYRLGNERDFIPGEAPVTPAAPAIVGGDKVTITPVALPPVAQYPGLKPWIQQAEIAAAEAELKAATEPLAKAAAEAKLKAVHAVIAADKAKYKLGPGDPATLAKEAGKAQALHGLSRARVHLQAAEQALAAATAKADKAAVTKATQAVTATKAQLAAAEKAHATPPATYTPLSPVYPATSTGRRKALALWITSRDNPLAARVAVNHIWMRHFGTPIVASVFDLGRNGKLPTHPGLLDTLAVELMENGWGMKHLHRLIVTSRAYRMGSAAAIDNPNLAKDPDNRWLWRYPARRLEAEAVRDAMLFTAGDLDPTPGGREMDTALETVSRRRSLYFSCHPEGGGSLKLLAFFDAPDPCDCYRRGDSMVPQQALALTNSAFTIARSQSLARGLLADATKGDDDVLTLAFERVLSRPPTGPEAEACRAFLKKQATLAGRQRAWESLVRVLFNHHDFITLR